MDQTNMNAPMNTAPMPQKKRGKGLTGFLIAIILIIILVAAVMASNRSDDATMNDTGYRSDAMMTGDQAPIENNTDDLDSIESDLNSMNYADIDSDLK